MEREPLFQFTFCLLSIGYIYSALLYSTQPKCTVTSLAQNRPQSLLEFFFIRLAIGKTIFSLEELGPKARYKERVGQLGLLGAYQRSNSTFLPRLGLHFTCWNKHNTYYFVLLL